MFKEKKIVAIIPARKGSKGIKNKNIIKLNNKPLISFSIDYAKNSKLIDRVFVSTDGNKISNIAKKYGAEIIKRPKKISGDKSSSDEAIIHSIKYIQEKLNYKFDIVVFLQPTTPLRQLGELDKAIKYFEKKNSIQYFLALITYLFCGEKKIKTFFL